MLVDKHTSLTISANGLSSVFHPELLNEAYFLTGILSDRTNIFASTSVTEPSTNYKNASKLTRSLPTAKPPNILVQRGIDLETPTTKPAHDSVNRAEVKE